MSGYVREGKRSDRIVLVGNIMIDSLEMLRPAIEARNSAEAYGLPHGKYAVATLHRPSNVDDQGKLENLVATLEAVAAEISVVFPIHPRTRANLEKFGLSQRLENSGVIVTKPLGYTSFMSLIFDCGFALTDSGGIQEETTYLGIPCLTVRDNTERPVTVTEGTNTLVRIEGIRPKVREILDGKYKKGRVPVLWDGRTAARVVEAVGLWAEGDRTVFSVSL